MGETGEMGKNINKLQNEFKDGQETVLYAVTTHSHTSRRTSYKVP
jgi:hypothetical protein